MFRKIAIGFVIYDPNFKQLSRIHEASRLGFAVYVYDNSLISLMQKNLQKIDKMLSIWPVVKMLVLGRGMASVCAQAYYDGHSALVFFDQDTVFDDVTLEFIDEYYKNNLDLAAKYSAILFNSNNYSTLNDANTEHFKNVSLAIIAVACFFWKT